MPSWKLWVSRLTKTTVLAVEKQVRQWYEEHVNNGATAIISYSPKGGVVGKRTTDPMGIMYPPMRSSVE